MKLKKEEKYNSDLVWARMKYCPYWPARIVTSPPSMGSTPRNKVCVLFFGSKEFGFVNSDKVVSYDTNKSQFIAKGTGWGASFANAVQQIDEYILDPLKYKSNAAVKAKNVVVKTERSVEIRLGIKRENTSKCNAGAKLPSSFSWTQEKQTLIDEIISLKSENQRCTLDLKKIQDKLKATDSRNQELEANSRRNNETNMKKVSELETDLTKMNTLYEKLKTDNEKQISVLSRDRDLLQAQAKQFQTVISQQIDSKKANSCKNSSDEEEYEVECLLNDKLIEKRVYLVRWKGFDASHDSWVEETNLNCPSILKKYKLKSKPK